MDGGWWMIGNWFAGNWWLESKVNTPKRGTNTHQLITNRKCGCAKVRHFSFVAHCPGNSDKERDLGRQMKK